LVEGETLGAGLSRPRRFTARETAMMAGAVAQRLMRVRGSDLGPEWTRPELTDLLMRVVSPADAEEVARAILEAFPVPPADPREAIRELIGAMRADPYTFVADPDVSSPVFGVRQIADVEALAAWQNMSLPELDWFAARGRRSKRLPERLRHYRVWRIPKAHGGFRIIEAPKERLAAAQRRILDDVLVSVPPHPAAHGFVRGRSAVSFSGPHSLHDTVVRIDLKHCFEHANYRRVKAVFTAIGYTPGVCEYLAALCTTTCSIDDAAQLDSFHAALLRERHLPQGAPTSPALLNLILRRMDIRIAGFAEKNRLTYTRYGDDLALSGDDIDPKLVTWVVSSIVHDEGFRVHPDKLRVMGDHQRQQLAGLVVNAGPRARRADFDALKALLHNAVRDGGESQNRDGRGDFRGYVYGRIGWVSTGSPSRRRKLMALAAQVDWSV